MLEQDYYPLINEGHTMRLAGEIDPDVLYESDVAYELNGILVFSDFPEPFPPNLIMGQFTLFSADDIFDFHVLTSLN
jgi:hypothetical protein